jgi:hypothetical protein
MYNNLISTNPYLLPQKILRPQANNPSITVIECAGIGNNDVFGGGGPAGPPGPPGPPGPAGNPSPVAVTDVATATYTALSTDYFLCVLTNGLVTVTLPTGTVGKVYMVKDCFGNAANFPITIQGTGGQLVDGAANATINTNYGSLQFVFNGVDWSIV